MQIIKYSVAKSCGYMCVCVYRIVCVYVCMNVCLCCISVCACMYIYSLLELRQWNNYNWNNENK